MIKNILVILCLAFIINQSAGGVFSMDNKIVVLETNQGVIEIKLMTGINRVIGLCSNF